MIFYGLTKIINTIEAHNNYMEFRSFAKLILRKAKILTLDDLDFRFRYLWRKTHEMLTMSCCI